MKHKSKLNLNWLVAGLVLSLVVIGLTLSLSNSKVSENTGQTESAVNEPTLYKVSLNKNDKKPITSTIKQSDYIQFNSEDGGKHQITQLSEGEHSGDAPLNSEVFSGEQGFRMQFKDIGIFYLQDKFIPELKITVTVTE